MSVREEDRRKNSCPSRGLGLAAAAIGVGVGAALYYFFSKRPENPDSEGSTSQEWSCEQPQTFFTSPSSIKSAYTTISENTTTDTSINDDDNEGCYSRSNDSIISVNDSTDPDIEMSNEEHESNSDNDESNSTSSNESSEEEMSYSEIESDNESFDESCSEIESNYSGSESDTSETGYLTMRTINSLTRVESLSTDTVSDADMTDDWDVTNSSVDIPYGISNNLFPSLIGRLTNYISPTRSNKPSGEDEQIRIIREQAFRERKWSLEECSICFEVMLKDQDLLQLPCTHNFHVACIGPWLQEQQTCPMCRKAAE